MSQEQTRSVLLVVLGAVAVWLWGSGQALNYVRPGLVPLVGAAGLVLLALGLLPPLGLLGTGRAGHRSGGSGDRGGRQHHHGGRVGWLLLVPVLVVLLIQPAALGSYAASSRTVVPGGGGGQFPPLSAPVRGAVPMTMAEFETRAVRDPAQSLAGVRVRLVGFAAPAEGSGGYQLTRFVIFCCAADAEALQAVVTGDPTPRARDQWLEVEGTWVPRPAAVDDPTPPPPVLKADLVRPVAPARPPYEYTVQFSG
ncbi:MAG TPA: TIGR03943 family protein [Actinomycetes bacterium]|nr:TIGR03943 family protein [Actinomycetes bacterium]